MTTDRPPVSGEPTCNRCPHMPHDSEWCDETVMVGSSEQAMCGCPPVSGEPTSLHDPEHDHWCEVPWCPKYRPPVSGEPRTEHGKRILREWLSLRPDHPPNTALIRDWITEAEAEASTGAALDPDRLWGVVREHDDLHHDPREENHAGSCGEWLLARLAEQEGENR